MKQADDMINRQLKARGIHDQRVLTAMNDVPRDAFLPAGLKNRAYEDNAVAIGAGQTISQPYIVGYMTQALLVEAGDRVLEIGTGSGYQAAVLSRIAAEIFTLERIPDLFQQAQERLSKLEYRNIHCLLSDGTLGWPDRAPFDKIIVTAACPKIPSALVEQLKDNGKLIAPVGDGDFQKLVMGVKHHGHFEATETIAVRFVPLV